MLTLATEKFAPVDLVALLRNGAVTLGRERGEVQRLTTQLDLKLRRDRTLPGLAGFVLAIGMAIDANVLAFERAREERAAAPGRSPRNALAIGFTKAWSAIADSAALVERVKLIQEELAALVNEQTSRTLFVLTVVTVLALPVNLVAGLFGMNVGGIPLAANGHGFAAVVTVLVLLTAVLAWFSFRPRGD